jgi:hypothetical protein
VFNVVFCVPGFRKMLHPVRGHKVARMRRDSSPFQHHFALLLETLRLQNVSYRFSIKFFNRRHPGLYLAVFLSDTAVDAAAVVDAVETAFDGIVDLNVIVTHCHSKFLSLCCGDYRSIVTAINVKRKIIGDGDDGDDGHEDEDDENVVVDDDNEVGDDDDDEDDDGDDDDVDADDDDDDDDDVVDDDDDVTDQPTAQVANCGTSAQRRVLCNGIPQFPVWMSVPDDVPHRDDRC